MKYTLIVLILLLFNTSVGAQELSLNQMLQFYYRPISETNELLVSKGWEFYSSEQKDDTTKVIKWSYDLERNTTQASQWLSITGAGESRIVYYSFNDNSIHDSLIANFNSVDYVKSKTRFEDDFIIDFYKDKFLAYGILTKGAKRKGLKHNFIIRKK